MRIPRRTVIAGVVAAALTVGLPPALAATAPAPVDATHTIGDPSVVSTGSGFVLTATGPTVPRSTSTDGVRWTWTTPALTSFPSWVNRNGGDIWAAEIAKVSNYWVLYYAAPVLGMTPTSRCIGVATAPSPTAPFKPYGTAPLVCPTKATVPPAADQMTDGAAATPSTVIGAIDPAFFHDPATARNWLIYKADGIPSSLRIVPLRGDGVRIGGASSAIISSPGVIENPSVTKLGSTYFLFASVGPWNRCAYKTVWFSSRSITSWTTPGTDFLTTATAGGLCGPGGLDVVRVGDTFTVFLAAWTCHWKPTPCESFYAANTTQYAGYHGMRSLYAARIVFQNARPVVTHWLPY